MTLKAWTGRCLLLAFFAPGAPALAQTGATYAGVLVRRDSTPVVGAEIRLGRVPTPMVTGESGRFEFRDVPPGTYLVTVRAPDVAPVSFEIVLFPGETYTSRIVMAEAIQRLSDVSVSAARPDATARRLEAFDRRRQRGLGTFLTADDIARRRPRVLSDALVNIPGTRIMDGGSGKLVILARAPAFVSMPGGVGTAPCILRVVLDGTPLPAGETVDFVQPNEVAGIEIYTGAASMPVEFAHWKEDSRCGLVVIWTRGG